MQRNKSCDVYERYIGDDLEAVLATTLSEPADRRPDASNDLSDEGSLYIADNPHISDLPENVIRIIAGHLLQSGGRQSSILSLLAMCGVCRQWRSAASHLPPDSSLLFDGSKGAGSSSTGGSFSSTLEQKYRSLPVTTRLRILHAAAALFRGYTSATFAGEAVDDCLLQKVAVNTNLNHIGIAGATNVTDAGISSAVMASPNLTSLVIGDTKPQETYGHFLGKVLALKNLDKLEIKAQLLDFKDPSERPYASFYYKRDCIVDKLPNIASAELEGSCVNFEHTTMPYNLTVMAEACSRLTEVHLHVDFAAVMDAGLLALRRITQLEILSVAVSSFVLSERQMWLLGELPVGDLTLISQAYKKQPNLPRPCYSHLDNGGVKAYVDAVCQRSTPGKAKPLKLSICGAAQLTHDAVSALLRLPVLVRLNIAGCTRIAAMDRMRLIAKIKAGREQQNATYGAAIGTSLTPPLKAYHLAFKRDCADECVVSE